MFLISYLIGHNFLSNIITFFYAKNCCSSTVHVDKTQYISRFTLNLKFSLNVMYINNYHLFIGYQFYSYVNFNKGLNVFRK